MSISRRKSWGRPRDSTDESFLLKINEILDKACGPNVKSPNWEVNLELCDLINKHPDRLSELSIKAIEKRLKKPSDSKTTNIHIARLNALILLDTVVKNCGEKVHQAAAHPDFVAALLDLAGKKIKSKYIKKGPIATKTLNYSKELVQEKVLSLFQSWGPLHKDKLPIFNETYVHLRAKGVKFPEILPEDETPWINDPIQKNRQQNFELKKENAKDYSFDKKLLNELDGMKQASILLNQRIHELKNEDASKDEISCECKEILIASRKKLVELINENVAKENEEKLLSILFLTHDRVEQSLELFEQHSGERRLNNLELDDDSSDDEEDSFAVLAKRNTTLIDINNEENQEENNDENDFQDWQKALKNSSNGLRYSTSNTLQIPSASDQHDSSIAIGLDYLASLSTNSAASSSTVASSSTTTNDKSKQDEEFMNWLLGPPKK
mmetsp:Transcript_9816/g.16510  ORF Transcript_9816/g.16510 Transcript_9816/m.16510 type:complete len:440 (+) Transcript_9816:40-1359(+)